MTVASAYDVETSLRRELTDVETQVVPEILARAEARLLLRDRSIVSRARADAVLRIAVAEVEAEAAARVLRSPADAIYKSEVEGEYQYHLNLAVASPLLDITDAEYARLAGTEWGSSRPSTDGYLTDRVHVLPPDLRLQFAWPGMAYPSSTVGG